MSGRAGKPDFSGYNYGAISSLILTTDCSALPRRDKEPDGAPTQDVEGLTYRPRTAETRQVYELILAAVHSSIGDQTQDIVRSAANTVLEVLKTASLKDFDKKKDIETVLGHVPNEKFSQLVNLSKKITDYNADDETMADPDQEAEINEEGGVAVIFDDEEEGFEIKENADGK